MADEVSCTLIAAAKAAKEAKARGEQTEGVAERVYKCTTWGSMSECLNYLLRRAAENKDAAGRTRETRQAMRVEIGRRGRGMLGL
ncbi:proline dehydrogenase, partial [Teratosphaeriaceae sp. CCFEE 6253]